MKRSHERLVTANLPLNLSSVNGHAALERALLRQARKLIERGLTPKTFSCVALRAFALAAAETSRLRNGRVNNSRVAARTGLSRSVVRKVLQPAFLQSISVSWAPIDSVMQGWCSDRRFIDSNGVPRTLTIERGRGSFKSLAKLYAGELPYRAVLDELKSLGLAVTEHNSVACVSGVVRKRYARLCAHPQAKAIHRKFIGGLNHQKSAGNGNR